MTRADRLNALVRRLAPKKQAFRDAHGFWPTEEELETGKPSEDQHGAVPYEIKTLTGSKRRILVTDDDGSTVAAIGENIEQALAALEAKVA